MAVGSDNLEIARSAILYVNKLGITSINVPFRLTSYYKSPLSKFDQFMLYYMRTEQSLDDLVVDTHARILQTDYKEHSLEDLKGFVKDKLQTDRGVRKQIVAILHSTKSKSQKKKDLKTLMESSHFDPDQFMVLWHLSMSQMADEARIRAARKAIKFRHGNCGEKSAIAATHMLEATKGQKDIFWVSATNWDHAWSIIGNKGSLSEHMITTLAYSDWPEGTVVADGWTGDWYFLKHYNSWTKSGSLANPFQKYVRKKVQEAAKNIRVQEELEWPPEFSPHFRLEYAEKPNKEYASGPPSTRKLTQSVVSKLDVLDDQSEAIDQLKDYLGRQSK